MSGKLLQTVSTNVRNTFARQLYVDSAKYKRGDVVSVDLFKKDVEDVETHTGQVFLS